MQKRRFIHNPKTVHHSQIRRKSTITKKKIKPLNLPKTTGIILLDGPERPEELLAPSKRFIKSPKSSPKSLSPVSSPTNSINSPSSSRLKSSVRTSFWDGKKKVDDLSTPTKPSPPPTKNINKMNGKFQSPKVNMIVNNNNEGCRYIRYFKFNR